MTDTAALLQSLRDIQEPVPPEVSIPWWMIVTAACLCIAMVGWWITKRRNRQGSWRHTLSSEAALASTLPASHAELHLAQLLRRMARVIDGAKVNALEGDEWLRYLDGTFNTTLFTQGSGMALGSSLYQPHAGSLSAATLAEDINALIKQWRPSREVRTQLQQALKAPAGTTSVVSGRTT